MSFKNTVEQEVRDLFAKGYSEQAICRMTNLQAGYVRSIVDAMRTRKWGTDGRMMVLDLAGLEERIMGRLLASEDPSDAAQLHELLSMDAQRTPYTRRTERKTPIQRLQEARAMADAARQTKEEEAEAEKAMQSFLQRTFGAEECNCPNCEAERKSEMLDSFQGISPKDFAGFIIPKEAEPKPEQVETLPEGNVDLIEHIKQRSTDDLTYIAMLVGRELNQRQRKNGNSKTEPVSNG